MRQTAASAKLRRGLWSLAAVVIVLPTCQAPILGDDSSPPKRAKRPKWTQEVRDAFFEDAREHLVGARRAGDELPSRTSAGLQGEPIDRAEAGADRDRVWSRLIDEDTLAVEVKRGVAALRDPLVSAAKFKSGGYKQCRAELSVLAVLFRVIAEYDGEIRWQSDATLLQAALGRAAKNCKTATNQSYAEAAERKIDLEEVIRGQVLTGEPPKDDELWSAIVDRGPLMQRMERSLMERISPRLASASTFEKSIAEITHEAKVLAMLSETIDREAYEYWDDDSFREHADSLQKAASDLTRAAVERDYEATRRAAGQAGQACSVCHEGYRG